MQDSLCENISNKPSFLSRPHDMNRLQAEIFFVQECKCKLATIDTLPICLARVKLRRIFPHDTITMATPSSQEKRDMCAATFNPWVCLPTEHKLQILQY